MSVRPTIYAQAILPAAGLGNRLFPWARCYVFSQANRVPMLAPDWWQLRPGAILRREADWRIYGDLFRQKTDEIGGLEKWWLQWQGRQVAEPEKLLGPQMLMPDSTGPVLYTFRGWQEYFSQLNGWQTLIYTGLQNITRPHWLQAIAGFWDVPIGIHVRRGDFATPQSANDLLTKGGMRTPLKWFVDTLACIRSVLGYTAKAYVVSDGRPEELADLLGVEDVVGIQTGSAIADLLLLARSKILIASGGSTFSAWAAFLGQMPTVSYPGQSLTWFKLENAMGRYVGEFDPQRPSLAFLNDLLQPPNVVGLVAPG